MLTHLGDIPVETFLKDYWQQKPLLIRQAFPDFESPLSPDELAGLALEPEVESRIILEQGKTGPWELHCGPFEESIFSQLPESHWTLLVQAVDQWVPEVQTLLDHFRFIPNWRLDDIMISYAADQGSVGPHFDYYDVFLLQAYGKRHWQLGQTCTAHSPRLQGTSLNILQDFEPEQDWILEPGDMLYIPPQVAHHGIGIGDCMTYSIGFRAPSHADILTEFSQELAGHLDNDLRYSDAGLATQQNPGEIKPQAIQQLKTILRRYLEDDDKLTRWFGGYMTSRKYPQLQDIEQEQDSDLLQYSTEDWTAAIDDGVLLCHHPAARFAYAETNAAAPDSPVHLFVDGETLSCNQQLAQLLCANTEISAEELAPFRGNDTDLQLITQLLNQEVLLLDIDWDDDQ